MFPVLFRIGNAAFYTYPLFFALAYFTGLGVWLYEGARRDFRAPSLVSLSLGAMLWGWIGARGLFVLTQITDGAPWIELVRFWEGGIVFFGGFLGAIAYLAWAMPKHGIARSEGFDAGAPAIAFAHAVGRIGCFANGCCHGSPCSGPLCVIYRNPLSIARPLETPLHPVQLYEAAGLVLLGFVLLRQNRRFAAGLTRHRAAHVYLALYGLLRFGLETLRGDAIRGFFGPFSTSQWIAVSCVLTGVLLDWRSARVHNPPS